MITHRVKLLMLKRNAGDFWNGLYDFYLIETKKSIKPETLLKQVKLSKLVIEEVSKVYKHILSHQQLITRFILCSLESPEDLQPLMNKDSLKFYSLPQVEKLPKPILVNRFLMESGYLD